MSRKENQDKKWENIAVYHSWTRLMSRLLFVTLMVLNMLDEVINTVQLSSLIMCKIDNNRRKTHNPHMHRCWTFTQLRYLRTPPPTPEATLW